MAARDILKDPPRYTTRFTASAHVYTPSEREVNEVHASLDRLKGLLPDDIDPAAHPTMLYVVGNLFVGGTLNRNGDSVTLEDTLRMYRAFEGQQINVEHSRASVVGYIVKAGLSEFGTDRLITEEEARVAGQPVNVAIVVGLWRVVDKELVQYIIETAIPASPTKDSLSFSFEVGFDEYSVVVLPKGVINLAQAVASYPPTDAAFKQWDRRLKVNKGSGTTREGYTVGRTLLWPIIPMGGGIVAQPAGAVKGIAPILPEGTFDLEEAEAGIYEFSSTQCTLSPEAAAPFLAYAESIPGTYLYETADPEKEGKYGREDQPHITALYGIKGNDGGPIQLALQGCGPVRVTLGKVSAFVNPDKPYDVLKVDVVSEDLHRIHALIKASCDHEETYPEYHPHLTIAYMRKGLAETYIGDTRFEGMALTFPSITFSPTEGSRTELWLEQSTIPPMTTDVGTADTTSTQTAAELVYSPSEPTDLGSVLASSLMSQPSRTLKLSAGWQEKLAAIAGEVSSSPTGELSYAGIKHGVDVTLSDGRVIKAMKRIDAATLGTDIEVSYDGVVITSMTPGVPAPEYMPPGKQDIYPTTDVEARAKAAANEAQKVAGQTAGYTGASLSPQEVVAQAFASLNLDCIAPSLAKLASAGVSLSTTPLSKTTSSITPPMDLNTLKQAVAAVKSVEDLPTVMANVAAFVDIIAKASEEQAAAKAAAEQSAQAANASLAEVKAQLATLTQSHNQLLAAQQEAAAAQTLQTRLSAIDEVFAFDDETRADILPEIKALADDAAFASWMPKAKRLYKGYLKASTTVAGENPFAKDGDKKDKEKESDDCKAAKAAQVAIASAAANVIDAPVHNTIDAAASNTQTLAQRYAAILGKTVSIGGVKLETLEANAKLPKKTR